jgi:Tfp pilus assembly protein PilX
MMHMLKKTTRLKGNEQGMVSLLVTTFVILIISLVVLGFAKVVQREQRQALDRQLSTQAFYAAETGINDAVKALSQGYNGNKTACPPDAAGAMSMTNIIDSTNNISYPCLLINQTPETLEFSSIGNTQAVTVPIHVSTAVDHIIISWQDAAGGKNFASSTPDLLPTAGWTSNTGVLRVSLTPISTPLTRDKLIDNTFTAFLYPQGGTGASVASYTTDKARQGAIVNGNCSAAATPRYCNVQISNLSGLSANNLFLQVRSFYSNSTVTVAAYNATNQRLLFKDAQAVVDSTGKVNDVLRRVQVRVPLRSNYDYPDFALDSSFAVCKRLAIVPSPLSETIQSTPDPSGCAY